MNLAALFIVVLSHQGYWFGGQLQTIALRPTVKGSIPAADCVWELRLDGATLDRGKIPIAKDKDTSIQLNLPAARTRVTLHWLYQIVSRDGGKELETGDRPINLFPDDLTSNLARRLQDKRLVVWDKPQGLPKALDRVKAPFLRVDSGDKLLFLNADVILVGKDAVGNSPFDLASILNLAKAGASVMIFRQTRTDSLLHDPLADRDTPERLVWRKDHPLLAGFDDADLQSLIALAPVLKVVRVPANEPALELGYYPSEARGKEPSLFDSVLLTRSIGKGRIVLCQIPLGNWIEDPRSQMFLRNAIDYLLTRPQATPAPNEGLTPAFRQMPTVPTIPVLWGRQ